MNGLVVVDCDTAAAVEEIERLQERPTTITSTGNGRHYYFQHPGATVASRARIRAGIDVRGDGGYVLAPESLHTSGRTYRWIHAPWEVPPAPLPERLRATLCPPLPPAGSRIRGDGTSERESARANLGHARRFAGILQNYGVVALLDEARRLTEIPLPDGNNKEREMAASAFRMGQLIPHGYLTEEAVMGELLYIWCERWSKPLARGVRTITYGMTSGQQQPRRISQRHRR